MWRGILSLMRAALAVVVCWAMLPCLAGTTDDSIPDARYVAYASGFAPYTLKLRGVDSSGISCWATAVAIAEHWALTAAHVAEELALCRVGDRRVDLVAVHPGWASGSFGRHDIAMLRVAEGFGLAFYPPLCDREMIAGETVMIAGYGVTGRLSRGHDTADGLLRAGTGKVDRVEGLIAILRPRRGFTAYPFLIAPGDSGGPLFLATGELAAINSLTMADRGPIKSRQGEESGHAIVSVHREWIESVKNLTPAR